MRKSLPIFVVLVLFLAGSVISGVRNAPPANTIASSGHVFDDRFDHPRPEFLAIGLGFNSVLSGAQEVTAGCPGPMCGVDTHTLGFFRIQFRADFSVAHFKLDVIRGVGVTQAHIHCGPAGTNGPVVAFLFGPSPVLTVSGNLSHGVLTNADITNDACGSTLAALAFAARAGDLYVNVHTVDNPAGEVRGQLLEN